MQLLSCASPSRMPRDPNDDGPSLWQRISMPTSAFDRQSAMTPASSGPLSPLSVTGGSSFEAQRRRAAAAAAAARGGGAATGAARYLEAGAADDGSMSESSDLRGCSGDSNVTGTGGTPESARTDRTESKSLPEGITIGGKSHSNSASPLAQQTLGVHTSVPSFSLARPPSPHRPSHSSSQIALNLSHSATPQSPSHSNLLSLIGRSASISLRGRVLSRNTSVVPPSPRERNIAQAAESLLRSPSDQVGGLVAWRRTGIQVTVIGQEYNNSQN